MKRQLVPLGSTRHVGSVDRVTHALSRVSHHAAFTSAFGNRFADVDRLTEQVVGVNCGDWRVSREIADVVNRVDAGTDQVGGIGQGTDERFEQSVRTATNVYDLRDRLMRSVDSAGRTIDYAYDKVGNLLSRTSANQTMTYAYDSLNRILQATAQVGTGTYNVTTYTYDVIGNRSSMISADRVRTAYMYDSRNRLTNLVKRTAASVLLFAATYAVDATGMRAGAGESDATGLSRTVTYQYDPLKRLTREAIDHRDASADRVSNWTFDAVGNRLTQQVTAGTAAIAATSYAIDGNDRLTAEATSQSGNTTSTAYSYDANGNTLAKLANAVATDYEYDDANRLREMRSAGARTTYAVNADGLRIAQSHTPATGPALSTQYLVDPAFAYAQVVEEFEQLGSAGSPRLAAAFAYADEITAQTRCTTPQATGCGGAQGRFVHADGFGSTRLLTAATAAVSDTWSYDAYGNEIARTGITPTEHLYRGEQFDAGLAQYYLRARYYDPSNGRFVSMDPFAGRIHDPLSLHKYEYAHLNPVMNSDPSGLETLVSISSGISGHAILAASAAGLATSALLRVGVRSSQQVIASRVMAMECARNARGKALTGPLSCPGNTAIPIVLMSGTQMPAISLHVEASQLLGRPSLLRRTWLLKDSNRRVAMTKCRLGSELVFNAGESCDEYPFASSYEGGYSSTVAGVPLVENLIQGGVLSSFYGLCRVVPDVPVFNEFVVIPVLATPRSFQCGG